MMFSAPSTGKTPANMAGMIAKYFATSLAIEKVVSAPRVISNCLPISTISISLVGLESRSTMLPASFAACVPEFIATPTSACASAGASLVPSPVIATSLPLPCSRLIRSILSLGLASARKSSTPGLARNHRRGQRIVAGDHDRANAHRAQPREPLLESALDNVLQMDHAQRRCILRHHQRRSAGARNLFHLVAHLLRQRRSLLFKEPRNRIHRALANAVFPAG